jgi:hypothetical protein
MPGEAPPLMSAGPVPHEQAPEPLAALRLVPGEAQGRRSTERAVLAPAVS